jgi:hypothetical protein
VEVNSKFKVQSSRFKVQGSRFKVQGSRFKVVHGHYLAAPPSMVRHIPLTKEASSEARYR